MVYNKNTNNFYQVCGTSQNIASLKIVLGRRCRLVDASGQEATKTTLTSMYVEIWKVRWSQRAYVIGLAYSRISD